MAYFRYIKWYLECGYFFFSFSNTLIRFGLLSDPPSVSFIDPALQLFSFAPQWDSQNLHYAILRRPSPPILPIPYSCYDNCIIFWVSLSAEMCGRSCLAIFYNICCLCILVSLNCLYGNRLPYSTDTSTANCNLWLTL